MRAYLLPRFLDHRLGFELLVGEGPGAWVEVSPRWGHRERYKRQAILYSWRVLGICRAEEEQSTTVDVSLVFSAMHSTSATLLRYRFWDSVLHRFLFLPFFFFRSCGTRICGFWSSLSASATLCRFLVILICKFFPKTFLFFKNRCYISYIELHISLFLTLVH